jgi:sensor domain CHASE-containing protein
MSPAAEILVIILSVFLAVFLVVAIILGIYLIRLSAEIRRVAQSAQKTVDHIESAVDGATRIISPMFVADIIGRIVKKFTNTSKKGK